MLDLAVEVPRPLYPKLLNQKVVNPIEIPSGSMTWTDVESQATAQWTWSILFPIEINLKIPSIPKTLLLHIRPSLLLRFKPYTFA